MEELIITLGINGGFDVVRVSDHKVIAHRNWRSEAQRVIDDHKRSHELYLKCRRELQSKFGRKPV